MIGRALDALRPPAGGPAERPPRPNELRREAVRAERLRREALRGEAATSQPQSLPEERRGPPAPPAAVPPAGRDGEPRLVAALATRSGLRQAWLLKEILGPPRALRSRPGDDPGA